MSAAPTDRFTPEPGLLVLEDGETFAGHAWGTRGAVRATICPAKLGSVRVSW